MTLTPNNYGNNGYSKTQTNNLLDEKQDTLVNGTNIKTINGNTILGSGNIEIGEGGTIVVDQTYDPTSIHAQSGVAVADALSNSMEMVTQNSTISNCVLDIPQNIKLELNNNTLTLKSGSVIVHGGSTYVTTTTTSDKTWTPDSSQYNTSGLIFVARVNGAIQGLFSYQKIYSGNSRPAWSADLNGSVYYNTDTKLFSFATNSNWIDDWAVAYPICAVEVDSLGNASFAKDSNGNDMIFNGAGFIGHHAFIYPNVKVLAANGFNADGSLNNKSFLTSSLIITELNRGRDTLSVYDSSNVSMRNYLGEFNSYDDLPVPGSGLNIAYVKNDNSFYFYSNNIWSLMKGHYTNIVHFSINSSNIVTDFTIRQPIRLATTEMLDKVQDQVDTKQDILTFDNIPTSASINPITSGGVYTALATKQVDLLTISGYDATKRQTLKNINGLLEWIDD